MAAVFELWSIASGNVVGCFETEAAALGAVREAIGTHGKDYAAGFALGREDSRGRSSSIAQGMELVQHALDAMQKHDHGAGPSTSRRRSVV